MIDTDNNNKTPSQSFFLNLNTMLPLGLYVASVSCSEFFGKFSREDYMQILALVKKRLGMQSVSLGDTPTLQKELERLLAPALYMGSALMTLYNTDRNRRTSQNLRQQVNHIDQTTDEIKSELQSLARIRPPS